MRASRLLLRLLLAATTGVLPGCASREPTRGAAGEPGAGGVASFDPDSIPDGYRRSSAALAWPFATRAFEVTPAGDIYNGDWLTAIRASADGVSADAPRVIAYEERWRPVAHWRRTSGDVRWDFEACALPGPPADSGLIASVEVRATNLGGSARGAAIEVTLEPRPADAPFVYFDAPDSARAPAWAEPGPAAAGGWVEGGARGVVARRGWRLAPGGTASLRLVLPAHPVPAARLSAWARTPHRERTAQARREWTAMVERGTVFDLGDPDVESAVRAALVVLLCCRERRGGWEVPIGNPFQYRDVWLRDGARAAVALALAGHAEEARRLAEGLTLLQWPNGAFLSQAGQLDGTGQVLWALGQVLSRRIPPDPSAPISNPIRDGWRWCEAQRALSRGDPSERPGLMTFGDPHDNENVRAQLVGNDAWSLAGYQWSARALRSGGHPALADSIERSRARYLADFRAALGKSGSRDIPASWQGAGLDWGNVAVAWPCAALPAGDPRCRALARRLWARAGGAGLVSYRTPDSLSYYLGSDLGTWALLAAERSAADSVLDALLRFRTASGGAAELFHRRTLDYGENLPPHATGAAALVTLIRNALVFDDGDTLELTLGARARWWQHGRVQGAPTRWGVLDLEFRSAGDSASWRWTGVPVWSALHLPPGATLAERPTAPLRGEAGGALVLAPPGTTGAAVRLSRRAPTF